MSSAKLRMVFFVIFFVGIMAVVAAGALRSQRPDLDAISSGGSSPLHEIGSNDRGRLGDHFRVYKMVHHGCEVFVVSRASEGYQDRQAGVSIATGRGCR